MALLKQRGSLRETKERDGRENGIHYKRPENLYGYKPNK
jgi:hypothetical protein